MKSSCTEKRKVLAEIHVVFIRMRVPLFMFFLRAARCTDLLKSAWLSKSCHRFPAVYFKNKYLVRNMYTYIERGGQNTQEYQGFFCKFLLQITFVHVPSFHLYFIINN